MANLLYTFILAHYNQYGFVFSAIDSILEQDYPAVEIVVMDDCSAHFDKKEVEEYIDKHKRENIKSVQILVNEENAGTVRSMNRALKASTGSLIQLFAADDRMSSNKVATRFANEFDLMGEDIEMLCAHAMIMDEKLTPPGEYFIPPSLHEQIGNMTPHEQFEKMALYCRWAMGAVCVRRSLYERVGYFDERYKYVEDWPFFLKVTRENTKVRSVDFKALDHRDGGISRSIEKHDTKNVQIYLNDVLQGVETEVFPYIKTLPLQLQEEIMENYYRNHLLLVHAGGMRRKLYWFDLFRYSPKGAALRYISKWRKNNDKMILWSLLTAYFAVLLYFAAAGQEQISPAAENLIMDISIVVSFCAGAFLMVNVLLWLARRVYRVYRTSKIRL